MNKSIIVDQQTNKVYFSKYLTAYSCWTNIQQTLISKGISFEFLPLTKDIWVRDYMPIQVSKNLFVQYTYNPDYLNEYRAYITDSKLCCKHLNLNVSSTDIVIDGGNVIKCIDKIIMTEKVFQENSHISRHKLIHKLEDLFQADLVFIPWDVLEPYGHADGMVRYINEQKVLLNCYCNFDKVLRDKLMRILSPCFEVLELDYPVKKLSNLSWAYINFLHIGDLILLPHLGIEEDDLALDQITTIYKKEVVTIDIKSLVKNGGGLHCISWNIVE